MKPPGSGVVSGRQPSYCSPSGSCCPRPVGTREHRHMHRHGDARTSTGPHACQPVEPFSFSTVRRLVAPYPPSAPASFSPPVAIHSPSMSDLQTRCPSWIRSPVSWWSRHPHPRLGRDRSSCRPPLPPFSYTTSEPERNPLSCPGHSATPPLLKTVCTRLAWGASARLSTALETSAARACSMVTHVGHPARLCPGFRTSCHALTSWLGFRT